MLSEQIELLVSGDCLGSYAFVPEVTNLETGKRLRFSEKDQDRGLDMAEAGDKSIWPLSRKLLGKRCRVCIREIATGGGMGLVAWKDYDVDESTKQIEFLIEKIEFDLTVSVDLSKYGIGKIFNGFGKNEIVRRVMVRLRRIDGAGLVCVSEGVDLNKSTKMAVFQEGEYVVDLLEYGIDLNGVGSRLYSEHHSFGYPIWAKKMKIEKDTKSIKIAYDELKK